MPPPIQLQDIARTILFAGRLEDKLFFPASFIDTPGGTPRSSRGPAFEVPKFPGRPQNLSRIGKAEFPKVEQLRNEIARGHLLHFFANHELLAMELMALMLLKFPDAEPGFRAGLARTIAEEQDHLRLYLGRMARLGCEFGDLPISDYFWNAIKDARSPLEFVTQMSLTLEQANLDYSRFYQYAVRDAGDEITAGILERVYREEIGHVKHGLTWFNRWRERDSQKSVEDDWDAYLRLLPPPMTPRRAKGPLFCADARKDAGFSDRFVEQIEVYSGSKGRPPALWIFNPRCEDQIVRGKPGLSPE